MLSLTPLFTAKTAHVATMNSLSVQVALRFRLHTQVDVRLNGVAFDSARADEAKHCLIILIGGKKVVFRPDESCTQNPYYGLIYVKGDLDIPECVEAIDNEPYINVNSYMKWLSQNASYSSDVVKEALNRTYA